MYSVIFYDCKNFAGNGGALCLQNSNHNTLVSSCSFLKCFTSKSGGCIFSQSNLKLKCISISNCFANVSGGSVLIATNNINLISIDASESYTDLISISDYLSNITSLNESSCAAIYQSGCLCAGTTYLNIKYSSIVNCRDKDGGSFNIYRALSNISYMNMINISSSSSASFGLLLFGYGCNASFYFCMFDHNNHPYIVNFYQKKDDNIVFNDCMFHSVHNSINSCTVNNPQFISSITYISYMNYGMCIQQPRSACPIYKKSSLLLSSSFLIISSKYI